MGVRTTGPSLPVNLHGGPPGHAMFGGSAREVLFGDGSRARTVITLTRGGGGHGVGPHTPAPTGYITGMFPPGWHRGVKISVSLTESDLATLYEFTRTAGLPARSAVVQAAVAGYGWAGSREDYAAVWQEWDDPGDQASWDGTAGDGLNDAAR